MKDSQMLVNVCGPAACWALTVLYDRRVDMIRGWSVSTRVVGGYKGFTNMFDISNVEVESRERRTSLMHLLSA
jgi:hypothetical protein